jgi:cob(I)alamin adenosyltransferase
MAAAAAAIIKLAAASDEANGLAGAAAAAAKALPDASVLAAVYAELQAALGVELSLLQQRLSMLGSKAAVMVEEVAQLHDSAHSQMAEQLHARYVAECSAVAALERVAKAAAVAGQPLVHGLRLEVRRARAEHHGGAQSVLTLPPCCPRPCPCASRAG